MATVVIDLEDGLYARLRADAVGRERSLKADLRHELEQRARRLPVAATDTTGSFWDQLRALREGIRDTHGTLPDTTKLIRQLRGEE